MSRLLFRRCSALFLLGLLVGCQSGTRDAANDIFARFFLEADGRGTTVVTLPVSEVRLPISPKPVLTEFDIVNVELAQVELGRCLLFQFTPAATRDLYRLTAANQGRRLVLFLNGAPVGARRIDAPLGEGSVLIFVERSDETLPVLVANLKRTSAQLQKEAARKK